ncbi:M24 family metallopeptidase [Natranaerobius thermophilus]|uniref:Peptidase M24 n=1 Tax=Natranaerobius thermophilus (strain ATCC BAA-1301 / DSM 18059 / JW/NM-WN-LF) TaxID=457570 RepID=B2A550_NATTJ|nr:Xaa-Pro peptidase family protein [Natranaerobius thermophilus]ACB85292.1 peptidase M24 [Natranaerobius thermophilus JW/NM-WN-LF]
MSKMDRLNRLRGKMSEHDIPALFVTKQENCRYLTGFTGSSGFILVTQDESYFLTDFRYVEQAEEQIPKDFKVIKHEFPMVKTLNELLKKLNIDQIYLEKNHITYEDYERYQENLEADIIPEKDLVSELRKIKDKEEVEILSKAIHIADEAFVHIVNFIEEGVTERDLALELEYFMKKQGAEDISFDIIVASGHRSSLPHGVASNKKIQNGEFIKMDFGAKYQGYCSDMTRTVVLGKASEEQKKIYDLVFQAQMNALDNIHAGLTGKEADSFARLTIEKEDYGNYFGHGLGHGVGMKVHESPRLSPNHEDELVPGMTVTVEPGVYIPQWGGVRIEDIVLVQEQGCEVLTRSTKDLIEI